MRRLLALAPLALTVAASAASANPLGMYGFGSRSAGLGGAVTADVEDFSASYYNPAGLVRGNSLRLEVGYLYAAHQLRSNGQDNNVDPAHGTVVGVVAPGRIFTLPFAFGLAFYLPDDRLSRSRSLPQAQPRWELYDNRLQLLYVAANLAVAPTPWLRFGGGVGFLSGTVGTLNIGGQIPFFNANGSDVSHTVSADLVALRYPLAGVQLDPFPWLSIGLAYRGSYSLNLSLDATVAGQIIVGRSVTDPDALRIPGSYFLSSRSTAVFMPQQLAMGVAIRPLPSLTIWADLTWVDYSAYVNPSASLSTALDLTVPAGVPVTIPAIPPSVAVQPANFFDVFVPRFAVEYRRDVGPHQLAFRGAWRFDASPVPPQLGPTNFMDTDRHGVSLGFGARFGGLGPTLPGGLALDVHGDAQFLVPRSVRKDDPLDPIGDYVLTGQVFSFGATLGMRF